MGFFGVILKKSKTLVIVLLRNLFDREFLRLVQILNFELFAAFVWQVC